jgi:hypothetical protein
LEVSVRLGNDIDGDFCALLLSKEVFVVGEVVSLGWRKSAAPLQFISVLTLGVLEAEELGHIDELGTLAADLEVKVGIDLSVVVRFGTVDRRLHLDTDIKGFYR